MIRELSWYIESGRFTDIVKEVEEKAATYASALSSGYADIIQESGEDFRSLCKWHMKRSGWRADEADSFDATREFFDGAEVNRKALDRFEREVIKAHMYQKHLWEFMGTTGSMTVISKSAMKRDGFAYDDYLPIEYKKSHPPKTPLSHMLKVTPYVVPIYRYLDGSVSTEYDKERAMFRFDTLKDKSGFDWSGIGWNPNYEVEKNGWHGAYDKYGVWTFAKNNDSDNTIPLQAVEEETIPSLELIRDDGGILLYDPEKSLLRLPLLIWLLDDGSIYGAQKIDSAKTVALIRTALDRMGAENITAVCAEAEKKDADASNAEETMAEYRRVLGGILSQNARLKGAGEVEYSRSKILADMRIGADTRAGTELFRSIQAVATCGATGDAAVQAIRSETVRIPLSLYDASDRKTIGLTEEDEELLFSYSVPEKKRALFSTTVSNLLKKERLLATGDISRKDLLDMAYSYIAHGIKPEKTVSVETTFARLCTGTDGKLPCEDVGYEVNAQLEAARATVPRQASSETQRAVDAAVAAVIRSFAAVRMSTGMTPEEAVNAAVKTAGGKIKESEASPQGGIKYVTPGITGREEGQRRIFIDIPLKLLVQEAAETPPQTKGATIRSVMANVENPRNTYNLFSESERNAWYKTKTFRDSGLSVEQAESLIAEERERRLTEELNAEGFVAMLSEETELDERHGFSQKQALDGTAAVKIAPATVIISATDAAAELNRGLRNLTKQAERAIRESSTIEKDGASAEPFKAWNPETNGVDFPKPIVAVGAENAMKARNYILAKKNAANREGRKDDAPIVLGMAEKQMLGVTDQEMDARDFHSQTQRYADTDGNLFAANGIMPARAELSLSEASWPPIHAEIQPQRPRDLADRQNARGFNPQSRQYAEIHGSLASLTLRNDIADINPAVERRGGARESLHGIITEKDAQSEAKDAEMRRMGRLNAAYERDRAELAKTDPEFARGAFRGIGHTEVSGEADGQAFRKILSMKKANLMVDLEKDGEKELGRNKRRN